MKLLMPSGGYHNVGVVDGSQTRTSDGCRCGIELIDTTIHTIFVVVICMFADQCHFGCFDIQLTYATVTSTRHQ